MLLLHASSQAPKKEMVGCRPMHLSLPWRLHEGGVDGRGLRGGAGGGGEVGDDGEGLFESGVLAEDLLAVLPLLR